MEIPTEFLWIAGIHCFFAVLVTISVLSCPFRFAGEKFVLFLCAWLIPYLGPIWVRYRLNYIGSLKGVSSSGGYTPVDIPPSKSGYDSGDSSGSSD